MKSIIEKQRETQIIEEYDVLVAGGGIAGVSAALAAARNGAKTLLIEKECFLGGLATLGLITIYLPLCDGMGKQVTFGIAEELFKLSIKHGAEAQYPKAWLENGTFEERKKTRYQVRYNPHVFALEMEQLLLKEGVEILYETLICDVTTKEQKIEHVIIENKSGRGAFGVKSVIDTTGDADICKLSRAKTEVFSKQNLLASWYYYFSKEGYDLRVLGISDIPEEERKENTPKPLTDKRFSGLDGKEISEMLILSHQHMLNDIKKRKLKEDTYIPVTTPTIPQLRMTRRMVGAYTLDEKEMHKHFEDSIGMISDWRKRGPVYEVPFSTLYGKEIHNLLTAGRCISVTDEMWDISRVIPACAVTGEAAGTAAAMTDNFNKIDISRLQQKLTNQGVILHN